MVERQFIDMPLRVLFIAARSYNSSPLAPALYAVGAVISAIVIAIKAAEFLGTAGALLGET